MVQEPSSDADRQLDFHPGMRMRWEITRSTEDTSGELFESTNWLDPQMPGPPVHVHPTTEESFEVIERSIDIFKNGEWSTVRAGETATVPAGVTHTLRNASDEPAKTVTRIQPAQRSEAFFRDMHRLIHEGKLKRLPPKEPRSAIYAAMLFSSYPGDIRATGPSTESSRRWPSSGRRCGSSSRPAFVNRQVGAAGIATSM
jgi:mannose-6-phosphate isomerase-like protein (cupin superfamily)